MGYKKFALQKNQVPISLRFGTGRFLKDLRFGKGRIQNVYVLEQLGSKSFAFRDG